jgi:hypothetical protein
MSNSVTGEEDRDASGFALPFAGKDRADGRDKGDLVLAGLCQATLQRDHIHRVVR